MLSALQSSMTICVLNGEPQKKMKLLNISTSTMKWTQTGYTTE